MIKKFRPITKGSQTIDKLWNGERGVGGGAFTKAKQWFSLEDLKGKKDQPKV